jgi:hypothetical protein
MKDARLCAVCGNATRRFLFRDETLGIPICSSKCEYEYLQNLTPEMAEQMRVVSYLDEKIEESKKLNRIFWGASGVALVPIILGIFLANVTFFMIGAVTVSIATLFTRYLEDQMDKLVRFRKRILI